MTIVYSIRSLIQVLNPISAEQDSDAAVALMLKHATEDFEVLLVKRVTNPDDPWSGDMAFPGGKRSSEDRNLKQTVIRETLEETNINLVEDTRFLGVMAPLTSVRRPQMKILPFIATVKREPSIKLNRKELESFVWVSMKKLFQSSGTVRFDFGEFPAYRIGDIVIWGLTYRILKEFEKLISRNDV